MTSHDERGFTAVEFAIVCGIILLLVAICPSCDSTGMKKWGSLIRRSIEEASRKNLGSLRTALLTYRNENKGRHPCDLTALIDGGKYLPAIPPARTPNYHPDSSQVRYGNAPDDTGGWLYDNVPTHAGFGTLWVNCTHTDTKGTPWTFY